MSQRYDLVVFGATGYTGQLVCKYLVSHPQSPSWAIAGRSTSRLSSLKSSLSLPSSVGVIQAETSNYETLTAMTKKAKALINIVGPYRPFKGVQVVKACVETDTHYVDLSGETGFNADIIQLFHLTAQAKGITIANSVGFDSLPFDLSTYLAVQKVKQLTNGQTDVKLAECAYQLPKDLSAGTLASAISMAADKQQVYCVRGDWLSPIAKPASLSFNPVRFFIQSNQWGAQNTFTIHNTRIVNRTWGLLQHHHSPQAYGQAFLYKEGNLVPSKFIGFLFAYLGAFSIWLLMNVQLIRSLVAKSMPANSGPSQKSLVESKLKIQTLATANDGTKAICKMSAKGHPGYLLTARMIVETALTILDDNDLKINPFQSSHLKGGVLTPALIGAERLAERLIHYADFTITTEPFESESESDVTKKTN